MQPLRSWARGGAFVAIACVFLGAGWSSGGRLRDARAAVRAGPRDASPAPEGRVQIGDELEVAGRRMQLVASWSDRSPDEIGALHAAVLQRRGLLPIVVRAGGVSHVSGFDPGDGLQHFVTALAGHPTLVLAGAVEARTLPRLEQVGTTSVPVAPGARGLLAFRARDGGAASETAQFVVAAGADAVTAWYRGELRRSGWSEESGSGAALLLFSRGPERLSVAVQALDARRGTAVFVTRSSGGLG